MPSLRDESRDLRKQNGCMNGIFQIFDTHHFFSRRRSNKRLLQGSQHQLDQPHATETVVKDGGVQRERPGMSTESSRPSFSSSSCSSTFSSLDTNRTETLPRRQIKIPDTQLQSRANKEHHPSPTKRLSDVVKESMHREARSLSIKSRSNDQRGTVMKHIDSPRPNVKATDHLGSPRLRATVQEGTKHSKDEQLTLARLSYDGREARDVCKSSVKHKENPRLSLDSKTSTMKALNIKVVPLQQERETGRLSGAVARLMGLDTFPDAPTLEASIPEEAKPLVSPVLSSPKSQNAGFVRKPTTCSKFPEELAPWRQQDSSQDSPKMAPKNRKILNQPCSVYGEIGKRITDLEFKKAGKDPQALKHILGAIQKKRDPFEDQRGEPAEFTLQRKGSSEVGTVANMKPAKVMEKAKLLVTSRVHTVKVPLLQLVQTGAQPTKKDISGQPQRVKSKDYSTHGRSSGTVSPRSQQTLSSDIKKQCCKKNTEKGSHIRRIKVKANDSVKLGSNSSLISQTETEIISLPCLINTAPRQNQNYASTHMAAVESGITIMQQPSPISVLDDTFYCEDSPSPVQKTTSFQDESPSPDEAEWRLETLNRLTNCTRTSHCLEYNHNSGTMKKSAHKVTLLSNEPDETELILKDSSFISETHQIVFSHHLKNPDMVDVLEQAEEIREAISGGVAKNFKMKQSNRIQRKIVSDIADEIVVRRITSGRQFTAGRNGTSPEGLLSEVYLEVDRVCMIPDSNLDEDDAMIGPLTADLMHQSEDWLCFRDEVPPLALDIERLIFKDLINELITGEAKESKRHHRKLFNS